MFRFILILAVLGGVAFFLSTNYTNRFNALKDKIDAARARLLAALESRLELVRKLNSALEEGDAIGRSAVSSALRTAEKSTITESIVEVGMLMGEGTGHLERATMQLRNPNISRKTSTVNDALNALEENTRQLKLAKREYNNHVRDFNKMRETVPASWVATLMKIEEKSLCLGPHERSID